VHQSIYPHVRQYKRQFTGSRDAIPARAYEEVMKKPTKPSGKVCIVVLILCLVVAVATALVLPLVLQNQTVAAATPNRLATAEVQPEQVVAYNSVAEATTVLGFSPQMPTAMEQSATLAGVKVLDNSILEMTYVMGKDTVVYRIAQGSDDISGVYDVFAYSGTEEANGVLRTYSGVSADVLSLAVWADAIYTYAIIATGGLSADTMRTIAESVA
jgi:hypothetical protein